jgi:hypothetical protein
VSAPSIKGSVFAGVVEAVRKLIEQGSLPEKAALAPARRPTAARPAVSIAGWYDVRIFDRMSELLRDVAGGGSNDYLREPGASPRGACSRGPTASSSTSSASPRPP